MTTGRGARAKGSKFQRDIKRFLTYTGFECESRGVGEAGDDIHLLYYPHFSLELKNRTTRQFPQWMAQAEQNAGKRIPVVVFKRFQVAEPSLQWVLLRGQDVVRWKAQSPVPIIGAHFDEFVRYDRIADMWKSTCDKCRDEPDSHARAFTMRRREGDYGTWALTVLGGFIKTLGKEE